MLPYPSSGRGNSTSPSGEGTWSQNSALKTALRTQDSGRRTQDSAPNTQHLTLQHPALDSQNSELRTQNPGFSTQNRTQDSGRRTNYPALRDPCSRGRVNRKVVVFPTSLSTQIFPPWASTNPFVI